MPAYVRYRLDVFAVASPDGTSYLPKQAPGLKPARPAPSQRDTGDAEVQMTVAVNSRDDFTLENYRRVAMGGESVTIGPEARVERMLRRQPCDHP